METEKIIKSLTNLLAHHERMVGVQKMGVASHFWNGRAEGVKDALRIIREEITTPTKETCDRWKEER